MIYFDNNATTPVDQDILDAMLPFFTQHYGNPSNTSHAMGWAADEAANVAREHIGSLLSASPDDVCFTAGATEAINQAIQGVAYQHRSGHFLTVATEHKAVLEACKSMQAFGFETTILPVDADGLVTAKAIRDALQPDTILTAVMWANNETGAIQPVADIASVVAEHRSVFFCDATQAIGKVPVSMDGIDLMALSAHKFYGPKGVGALIARAHALPARIMHGGGQERGRRAGTLNVPGIVGLGAAAAKAERRLAEDGPAMAARRDRFERELKAAFPALKVNSAGAPRLPQTSSLTFPGVKAGPMMAEIGTIAVSTGSACSTGSGAASHVLKAMGVSGSDGEGTVRFSMSRHTTDQDIDDAVSALSAYLKDRT